MSLSQDFEDIRTQYKSLRTSLVSLCYYSKRDTSYRSEEIWNRAYIDETSARLMKFLRSVETVAMDALALTDNKTLLLATRTRKELDTLRVAFDGRSEVVVGLLLEFGGQTSVTGLEAYDIVNSCITFTPY